MFIRIIFTTIFLIIFSPISHAQLDSACRPPLIEKAEIGDTASQAFLGWCYSQGHGFKQNHKEAFKWYSKAAISGDPIAQNNLATMLLVGRPYRKNEPLAAQWYMQSAMQGNAQAQYNLATMYRHGTGIKRDYAMALKWYKEAAYRNYAYAMDALAYMHEKGLGMDAPDEEKAAYWRKHASIAENPENRNPWQE